MFHWISSYNYDFAIASVPIQLILLLFFLSRKNLPVHQSRSFLMVMVVNLVMTVSDIIACEMNEVWQLHPLWLMYGINILYFLTFILRGYLLFMYTADSTHARRVFNRSYIQIMSVPCILMCALILFTPYNGWIFGFQPESGYCNGSLYPSIYWSTWFYLLASLAFAWICRRQTSHRRLTSIYAFNLVLIVGILIRHMFYQTLVTSFFSIIAILLIYLSAQNPDIYHDRNVGVFNVGAFDEITSEFIHDGIPFSIIGIAMNHYETLRSVYGVSQLAHSMRMVGQWLEKTFPNAYTYYLGNGKFFIIDPDNRYELNETADLIRRKFSDPWTDEETEASLDPVFVFMPREIEKRTSSEIRVCIEQAMDSALQKSGDRSIHTIDDSMLAEMSHADAVDRAVARALQNDSLEIWLQPIWNTKEKRFSKAEVLARLNDPVLGFISPEEFIAVAERKGTIMTLGRQIFEKACTFMEEHPLHELGIDDVNVNLSPAQCMNEHLSEELSVIAAKHHVDMKQIDLEVTETAIDDLTVIEAQLRRLHAFGTKFSLDDYGKGTSNLSRLFQLPFSIVKIDMSIVWAYFSGSSGVLPHIIRMFRSEDMDMIAEGVETKEMADALSEWGVQYLQGYYYAKPMPPEEFIRFLKHTEE